MEWQSADYVLWSDSTVALHWIRKLPCTLKTFIANRVASIQTNTEVRRCRHVGTKDNPVDLLSRGVAPADLLGHDLWLHGPAWLVQQESEWPVNPIAPTDLAEAIEKLKVNIVTEFKNAMCIWSSAEQRAVPLLDYASSLRKLVNILGNVYHYLHALKTKRTLNRKTLQRQWYVLCWRDQTDDESIRRVFDQMNTKGTEWKFMVPAAPHQGGIYEAAVKSFKYQFIRIVRQRVLACEHFITLLIEIEAVLNSRPIYPPSDDSMNVQALTPGHFLVGEPIVLPPPVPFAGQAEAIGVKLFNERHTMLIHFWTRWQEEYLATLQERKKWRKEIV